MLLLALVNNTSTGLTWKTPNHLLMPLSFTLNCALLESRNLVSFTCHRRASHSA